MRVRDYIGIPLLVIGTVGVTLGHHWLGTWVYWSGFAVVFLAIAIISSGGLQEKIERALRSYNGPGDWGNTDYHGGRSSTQRDLDDAGTGGD